MTDSRQYVDYDWKFDYTKDCDYEGWHKGGMVSHLMKKHGLTREEARKFLGFDQ